MLVAPLDFFVEDHAIKPLLGRFGNQLFGQGDMFLGGKAEAANDPFQLGLGLFDSL